MCVSLICYNTFRAATIENQSTLSDERIIQPHCGVKHI